MRIVLLIESLGSGGAERQLCTLAVEFKRRGHDVVVATTYATGDFYLPMLKVGNVTHVKLSGNSRLGRLLSVRRFLRTNHQDVVLAFLEGPCTYAELASLPSRKWGLVVSERSILAIVNRKKIDIQKKLHLLSDYITTNSHINRLMLEKAVPKLFGKIVTIYNAVNLKQFSPNKRSFQNATDGKHLHFVVAASYQAIKNMTGLVQAVALLQAEHNDLESEVDWYGEIPMDDTAYNEAVSMIQKEGLEHRFRLNSATTDIAAKYREADALIHPSFYEGLPNAVCEAMACGKPILMSAVCDAGNLVKEGENGFLFDPRSPRAIAKAIFAFASLKESEREAMGAMSRRMAETFFCPKIIADCYIEVLEAAAKNERKRINHWITDVPETAKAMMC